MIRGNVKTANKLAQGAKDLLILNMAFLPKRDQDLEGSQNPNEGLASLII
jgi:hypothetical protein